MVADSSQASGDAFKLYWHFRNAESSGMAGVLLTLFLYLVLTVLAIAPLFVYLWRWHRNGHIMDSFHRVTASEPQLFVPLDTEVSARHLKAVVKQAEQWRGQFGARRVVTVLHYEWQQNNFAAPST
jgi:hypothetical protein